MLVEYMVSMVVRASTDGVAEVRIGSSDDIEPIGLVGASIPFLLVSFVI